MEVSRVYILAAVILAEDTIESKYYALDLTSKLHASCSLFSELPYKTNDLARGRCLLEVEVIDE